MDVQQLINTIDDTVLHLEQGDVTSDGERQQLLKAAKRLQNAAESPVDSVTSISFEGFVQAAVLTAMRMKLFDALAEAKEGQITADELAVKTDSEGQFVSRIMRFLIPIGYAKELGVGIYAPTKKTSYLVTESPMRHAVISMSVAGLVLRFFPEYCVKTGFKNADDSYDGPFQYAMKRLNQPNATTYWEFLKNNPEQLEAFNQVMKLSYGLPTTRWYDIFPCEERFKDTKPDQVLLVDIGGGEGNNLAAFHDRFPDQPGQLILQDLPQVIDDIKELSPAIQRTRYDFFAPQPVRGAKAYFMRNVLHDWSNKQALQILNNIRDAMSTESVLLLTEPVVPDRDVSLFTASLDFLMMSNFSALERTRGQWNTLLDSAGLQVVKVWISDKDTLLRSVVFEAVKKD